MYRARAQSNTSGVLTWTFDRPFAHTPVVTVTVEDTGGSGSVWNYVITAISTTAVTIQLLEVVKTDVDKGLLLVRGAVPGSKGGWVFVRDAVKRPLPKDAPFAPPTTTILPSLG